MCTNLIYFLQEENEITDMCPYFFQEENENANMGTNLILFLL